MKCSIFCCCFCLLLAGSSQAAELPDWQIARRTILGCYGGWDMEVLISGGYEHRVYDSGPVDGEFANATITVPIYSRKQRLDRQEHTNGRVEHLAELYSEHQSQNAIMDALAQEKKVLKRTMLDDGATGIAAYYGLIKEIEMARSNRDGAGRKISNWLELCGYKKGSTRQQTQIITSKQVSKVQTPIRIAKKEQPIASQPEHPQKILVGVGD